MRVVLETQAVTKTYQGGSGLINAVDAVALSVHEGEFVALVGPSGSGKTTMLAMLAALLKPTAGAILIDAVSYTHLRAHETVLDLVCRLLLDKQNTRIAHQRLIDYLL